MTDNLQGGIINIYIYMYLRTYMFYRNNLPFFKIYFRNSMLVHGLEHKKKPKQQQQRFIHNIIISLKFSLQNCPYLKTKKITKAIMAGM